MEPTIIVAVVASLAAVIGALVGYLSARVQASEKIRELRLGYEQKLHESYLQNARQYTQSLYVPLTLAFTRLRRDFDQFRRTSQQQRAGASPIVTEPIRIAIERYLGDVDTLSDRGAGAFITASLERHLALFRDFLTGSLQAADLLVGAVFSYNFRMAGLASQGERHGKLRGRAGRRWASEGVSINLFGLGISYEANEILAAPLDTPEFAIRMERDLGQLSALVKEVTLGAQQSPPGSTD